MFSHQARQQQHQAIARPNASVLIDISLKASVQRAKQSLGLNEGSNLALNPFRPAHNVLDVPKMYRKSDDKH